MSKLDVLIEADDDSVIVTVTREGKEPEHFGYDMPGNLTGADLRDVLEACGIQARYKYEEKGDDLCDTCMSSDRVIDHTHDGKTVCTQCADECAICKAEPDSDE